MSERITDAELQYIFDDANLEHIDTTRPKLWDSATVLGLVAEVRRLRGLIADAAAFGICAAVEYTDGSVVAAGYAEGTEPGDPNALGGWKRVDAEAHAIREENARVDPA